MELGLILVIAMVAALIAVLLTGFPVAFTLAGVGLIFGGIGVATGAMTAGFLELLPNRIFSSIILNDLLFAVPLFVTMGVMLEKSRVAEDLLDSMARLFGSLRGGLGISVTVVGALLAASTGIVGATVVTMGLLSLPTMLKRGYDPALATGSIAAAGTLGQIIPPSIVLILLADVLSNAWQQAQTSAGLFSPQPMSAGELFAGALVPGLMLVGLYITYQALHALFRPASSPAVANSTADTLSVRALLLALLPPLVLIIAVLGSILSGFATPTEAASVGAIGAMVLGAARRVEGVGYAVATASLSFAALMAYGAGYGGPLQSEALAGVLFVLFVAALLWVLFKLWRADILPAVLTDTIKISAMVYAILIGAAVFSLTFRGLGGDDAVRHALESLGGGFWGALIAVMVLMFILGFFLDFIEITFIVVPVVAPALLAMDGHLGPIWLGVMMAVNLQTSFLTPPFGFALFYLRGVVPESVPTSAMYKGVLPYVLIQLGALALLALFPEIVTALPEMLF